MAAYEIPWQHDGVDLLVQVQLRDEGMRVLSVSEALTGEERPDLLTEAERDQMLYFAACEAEPERP